MSVHISSRVWAESKASGTALVVLLALADMANDEGYAWPSVGTLVKRARLTTDRGIQKVLTHLAEELGEIVIIPRAGHANWYRVIVGMSAEDLAKGVNCRSGVNSGSGCTGVRGRSERQDGGGVNPGSPINVSEPSMNRQEGEAKPPAPPKRTKANPKGKIPDAWSPNPTTLDWVAEKFPDADEAAEREAFVQKALALGWQYADWQAGYKNWFIQGAKFAARDAGRQPAKQPAPAPKLGGGQEGFCSDDPGAIMDRYDRLKGVN